MEIDKEFVILFLQLIFGFAGSWGLKMLSSIRKDITELKIGHARHHERIKNNKEDLDEAREDIKLLQTN